MSISAKSAASTPPAPARIVMTAGRSSHSPSSSVCTSRSPTVFCSAELGARLGGGLLVVGLLRHLDEHLEVVEPLLDAGDARELGLAVAERARDLLGALGVVPEVGHAACSLSRAISASRASTSTTARMSRKVVRREAISCVGVKINMSRPA